MNERSRKEVELIILGTEATAEPYIAATNLFGAGGQPRVIGVL